MLLRDVACHKVLLANFGEPWVKGRASLDGVRAARAVGTPHRAGMIAGQLSAGGIANTSLHVEQRRPE